MIQRIKTEEGDRWAIVLRDCYTFEDFVNLQKGLLGVLQASTHSDLYDCNRENVYFVLDLLEEMTLNNCQANEYGTILRNRK